MEVLVTENVSNGRPKPPVVWTLHTNNSLSYIISTPLSLSLVIKLFIIIAIFLMIVMCNSQNEAKVPLVGGGDEPS